MALKLLMQIVVSFNLGLLQNIISIDKRSITRGVLIAWLFKRQIVRIKVINANLSMKDKSLLYKQDQLPIILNLQLWQVACLTLKSSRDLFLINLTIIQIYRCCKRKALITGLWAKAAHKKSQSSFRIRERLTITLVCRRIVYLKVV